MRKQITAFLAIAVLIVSGCAPRAGADAGVSDGEMHVSFPSILVEYDESGEPSVMNMSASDWNDTLGVDLSALAFEADTIADLTGGGINAIHIDNQPGGLRFFIDGESYPSLVWDDDARAGLVTTLDQMSEEGAGPLGAILGMMPDLGLGLTMAMPGASDQDLVVSGSSLLDEDVADETLSKARAVNPVAQIALAYDENGVPSGQLPPTFAMAGVTPDMMVLPADTLASFTDNGIESLRIMPTGSGIIISINGNDLPYIAWDNSELQRLLGLLPVLAGDGLDPQLIGFLPTLLGLPISIELEFPS